MEDKKDFFPSDKNEIFADYMFVDSSYESPGTTRILQDSRTSTLGAISSTLVRQPYNLPLDAIRKQLNVSEKALDMMRVKIEKDLLSKITISPFIDPDLESAHYKVWQEASKYMDIPDRVYSETFDPETGNYQITKTTPPDYICFEQIVFCEKYQSTACRSFLKEFYEAINHTTFSYLFYFRSLIKLFENENSCIKNSLIKDFGASYENESQQKIALQYDSWSKMALHYTRRVSETILSKPKSIPTTELDKVSKTEAAKFQAFFAIRVNAIDSEIQDLLDGLKRDMVDNCDLFYNRYLRPAVINEKDIGESLDLSFTTTESAKNLPTLNKEMFMASSFLTSNFKSIYMDMMERMSMIRDRADAVFNLVREKKKYSNYMTQLSIKGAPKQPVIRNSRNKNYPDLFRNVAINTSRNDALKSSHSNLDDLGEDSHPQYLLRGGGTVTGNISVDDFVTIDGVDISDHAHTGADGSVKIKSTDIDWDNARDNYEENSTNLDSLTLFNFSPDLINGGVPVVDVNFIIELGYNEDINKYDFDIIYKEVD
jgi:hypothetical protein